MLSMRGLRPQDLQGLSAEAITALAAQTLQPIELQTRDLEGKRKLLERKDRDIACRDAKIEKITFELTRLKRWKLGAESEAMTAEQRQMFQDTILEDEADLEAQLAALRAALAKETARQKAPPRRPRRQALPDQLRRVEHHHEPEDTTCTAADCGLRTADCGQPMTRVGEDINERLDIVPAAFFLHRHLYGKWTCRCCLRQGIERLLQEPADPQIIDGGIPASGLVADTLISRFVDHLPYYRQEIINARAGVHTPRSTLARWAGEAGAALLPLYEAHKRFVLGCSVLHADETPVPLLDPGAGKTRRAHIWAYARAEPDPQRGVIYEFCLGRGRSTRWPSWVQRKALRARRWRSSRRGMERWSATNTPAATPCSTDASTRSASPPIASRMPEGSSTNRSARARWRRRRSSALAGSITSKASSTGWTHSSVWRRATSSRDHCGRNCTSG
jgi:transposase